MVGNRDVEFTNLCVCLVHDRNMSIIFKGSLTLLVELILYVFKNNRLNRWHGIPLTQGAQAGES